MDKSIDKVKEFIQEEYNKVEHVHRPFFKYLLIKALEEIEMKEKKETKSRWTIELWNTSLDISTGKFYSE